MYNSLVMNENIFNKAMETAMKMADAWLEEQLKMGIRVSEAQFAAKAASIYEKVLLNTKLDVLNF